MLGKSPLSEYHAPAPVQDFTSTGVSSEMEACMAVDLKGRSFLKLLDFTPDEIRYFLQLSAELKAEKKAGVRRRSLEGRNIALLFEKPSTRTRCAFTVACIDEGAHPEYLGKGDIQFGKKETVADTARVLGRMFDGIEFRGFAPPDCGNPGGVCRSAGVERAHRRLAPDPVPGRCADDAGGIRRPQGPDAGLRGRWSQQRRQLADGGVRQARHALQDRQPRRALSGAGPGGGGGRDRVVDRRIARGDLVDRGGAWPAPTPSTPMSGPRWGRRA